MRILLTNDDGIHAPGFEVLTEIARQLAGPEGEVWAVAPAFEQSGVGHCISYIDPVLIEKVGERRYMVEGTPADCIMAGLYEVLGERRPDLVLSGVNRGNNSGENALYSGTLGGAIEAALQGVPAIALSQFIGPRTAEAGDHFDCARQWGVQVIRTILDHNVWDQGRDYSLFYSVNFPPCSAADCKGTVAAAQGRRQGTNFTVEPHVSPTGRRFLWLKGGAQRNGGAPGTDVSVNLEDYISVTPMRCDLTAHDQMTALAARFA